MAETGYQYSFPAGRYVSVVYRQTPQGERLTYNYNANAQLESVEEPTGRRVTLSYNADGKVQTVADWGGRGLVVLTYVGSDLTEVWQQEGVVTRYRYDANHYMCHGRW
jgi:YD repeat-containing protein